MHFLLLSVGFLFVLGGLGRAGEPLPKSMGAMGDSITRAALAGYTRSDSMKPWVRTDVIGRFIGYGLFGMGRTLDRPELSWSAGLDPQFVAEIRKKYEGPRDWPARSYTQDTLSHATRIQAMLGDEPLEVRNSAVTGDVAHGVLRTQLRELGDWSRRELGQAYPDYVTVMIGANDVCQDSNERMTAIQEYERDLVVILGEMMERSSRTRVLVSSIPDIERLPRIVSGATLYGNGTQYRTCRDLWELADVCANVTLERNPASRAIASERIRDINGTLKALVARLREAHGDRIRFSERVYNDRFNAQDVAVDCFHPNVRGQNRIAEETFKDTWWAEEWQEYIH